MDSSALARPSSTQSDNCKFLITPHRHSERGVCEVFVLNTLPSRRTQRSLPASSNGLHNLKLVKAES